MRRILTAIASVLGAFAILAGVFGTTSPAYALNGYINGSCITGDTDDQIAFYLAWDNPTSSDIEYLFDTGIPGEPTTSDVALANTEDAIDFSRGLNADIDGQTYTMSIKFDGVVVFEADWVNDCPWQGMTVTVDEFTAASDPSPSPSESVTPTPTVEPTPSVPVTVEPTPSVTPTQPAPQPQAVKGLKVKVKKAKVKATWKSGTATKWQCKTKVVKGKTKVKPKKRTVTSAKCTFKVKPKTKKAKVKVSVREVGGPYKTKTVKLKV